MASIIQIHIRTTHSMINTIKTNYRSIQLWRFCINLTQFTNAQQWRTKEKGKNKGGKDPPLPYKIKHPYHE